jgi:hypothetical protein
VSPICARTLINTNSYTINNIEKLITLINSSYHIKKLHLLVQYTGYIYYNSKYFYNQTKKICKIKTEINHLVMGCRQLDQQYMISNNNF